MTIVPVFVPVCTTVHVVTVPVVVIPVLAVEPVFITIVIFFVTGSITIWKFPVVSALVGKARRRAVTMKKIQSNFLFMRKIYI